MNSFINKKIGVLGGGQLGKMLCQASNQYHLNVHVMDPNADAPAAINAPNFVVGDYRNYSDVYEFGRKMDFITIEIEHVNIEALRQLEEEGVVVHPRPDAIETIQDKGLQKQFFQKHKLKTLPFVLTDDIDDIYARLDDEEISYPFVQKIRKGGFDGRGVAILHSEEDDDLLFDEPSVIEPRIRVKTEISIVGCTNGRGEVCILPPVQMVFDENSNALDFLTTSLDIDEGVQKEILELASRTLEAFDIQGLLAIEFLVGEDNQVYINEVAPRPHNSGHHTIEACGLSQFDIHLRGVLGLPLSMVALHSPAALLNIVGPQEGEGKYRYEGMDAIMAMSNVHVHLYGKSESRPNRKLGHITVLGDDKEEVFRKIQNCKKSLKIKIV